MTRSKADTRGNILAAAAELVQEDGLAGLSIDRVLKRAGLSKGGFFHHFPSKEALIEALVDGKLDAFEARVADFEAEGLSFPQALFEALFQEVEANAALMASVNAALEFGGAGYTRLALARREAWVRQLFKALDPHRAQLAALALDGLLYQSTLRRHAPAPDDLAPMATAIRALVAPEEVPR